MVDHLNAGPLPGTIADFWRMIWELKITTLIMLTETMEAGKVKKQSKRCVVQSNVNISTIARPKNAIHFVG